MASRAVSIIRRSFVGMFRVGCLLLSMRNMMAVLAAGTASLSLTGTAPNIPTSGTGSFHESEPKRAIAMGA